MVVPEHFYPTNPQVTLLYALLGERDWQDHNDREKVDRLEDIQSVMMDVYIRQSKKDITKATGALLNKLLTEKNIHPTTGREIGVYITWLKTLPRIDYD